ncbi:hypothetical protein L7F22_027166 [Adiantum nelumboides]|nr:hypothetical protein [Adiantum nelumboides]
MASPPPASKYGYDTGTDGHHLPLLARSSTIDHVDLMLGYCIGYGLLGSIAIGPHSLPLNIVLVFCLEAFVPTKNPRATIYLTVLESDFNKELGIFYDFGCLSAKETDLTLKSQGVKPENIEVDAWEELDEMYRSTIRLSLSKSIYYNVKDAEDGAYELWQRICDMYDKHSAASMVYWIKKLIDFRMEEGASMNAHLNEFNTIFRQLATQKITFEDIVKSMFYLSRCLSHGTHSR